MALHGKPGASFAKSNHPAKDKKGMGLSGLSGKVGKHASLKGVSNPVKKGIKANESKSMSGMNPLFHPGNKMAKG